jgi:hypothetical protein
MQLLKIYYLFGTQLLKNILSVWNAIIKKYYLFGTQLLKNILSVWNAIIKKNILSSQKENFIKTKTSIITGGSGGCFNFVSSLPRLLFISCFYSPLFAYYSLKIIFRGVGCILLRYNSK